MREVKGLARLIARVIAAAVIAAVLVWADRAHTALALRIRSEAHTWLTMSSLPAARKTPKTMRKSHPKAKPTISYAWPVYGVVKLEGQGIVVSAPGGTLVHASAAGTVLSVSAADPGVDVAIQSGRITLSYVHLGPSYVRKGETVRTGEAIGEITHFPPNASPELGLTAKENGRATSVVGLLGPP